ncbi:hypothetical protein [Candidatus Uabimicrobium sp. HlEnr_7]|uniref:hypothetical protein n=1 Tax=Candidatus Uabimicrobium helgolandensis TaxID=3095367 RepID=UPI0035578414
MKLEELQQIEAQRKIGESINEAMQRVEETALPAEISQEIIPDEEGFVDSDIVIPRYKISQPTTRIEDAQPGNFRNILTGEEFAELENVIFLKRANGRVLFKKDDYSGMRECWSHDGAEPSNHVLEKTGQRPKCERCVTSMTNKKIVHCHFAIWKDEPPECKEVISFLGLDQSGLPFWICFHGSAIPIVKGFLGTMYLKKKQGIAQGKNICLRDFKLTIGLNLKVSAKGKYYTPVFKSQQYIQDEEERSGLSALFSQICAKTMEETITVEETLNI